MQYFLFPPVGIWASGEQGGNRPARNATHERRGAEEQVAPRIQIVEDESLIAWTLEATLEDLGYAVCGMASTGQGAIRMAQDVQPDLILMDIRLADQVSGLDAAEAILAKQRVPIIFITAFSDRQVATRVTAMGAELLPKPVDPGALNAVIRRLLDRQHES